MSEILDKTDFIIYGDKVKLSAWIRKGEMDKILQAIKLQELVKEKIKECKANAGGMVYGLALEHLIEESEKWN